MAKKHTREKQEKKKTADDTARETEKSFEPATTPGEKPVSASEESSAETKLAELNDRYLRVMAEYDNYRKRTEREKSDIIRTAEEDLMKELLPVLDDLDRATAHRNDKQKLEEYVKGISLIENRLRAALAHAGLEPMNVVGEPFDPAAHEAVMQIEAEGFESGTIAEVVEKGYSLSGKIIRHPKVIVSK